MKKTDVDVIELMLRHSNDIQETIKIFGDDIETFINNRVYQRAVIDCLLQIGELTTHLSDDFKNATSDRVNWVGLKVFRNISAHRYMTLKFDQTWQTMHNFLPGFIDFCESFIEESRGECDESDDMSELEL